MKRKALLLSGGIDSTAVAFWLRPDVAYTVDYGQSAAKAEIETARFMASQIGCEHVVLSIDASQLGCGAMSGRPPSAASVHEEWWPFRNQFLLTVVGMHSVQNNVDTLIIGAVRTDNRHADGSADFLRKIDGLMSMQEGGLRVLAPAIQFTATELIAQTGLRPSILLHTHSCHRGDSHCCDCPGCRKRMEVLDHFSLFDS